MRDKLSKGEIKSRPQDYNNIQYDHGGSRIYIDGKVGNRQLLVDTYYNEDFANYINKCVREYIEITFSATGTVEIEIDEKGNFRFWEGCTIEDFIYLTKCEQIEYVL